MARIVDSSFADPANWRLDAGEQHDVMPTGQSSNRLLDDSGIGVGFGFGKRDEEEPALALQVHFVVPSTMAISSGVRP